MSRKYVAIVTEDTQTGKMELSVQDGQGHWSRKELPGDFTVIQDTSGRWSTVEGLPHIKSKRRVKAKKNNKTVIQTIVSLFKQEAAL